MPFYDKSGKRKFEFAAKQRPLPRRSAISAVNSFHAQPSKWLRFLEWPCAMVGGFDYLSEQPSRAERPSISQIFPLRASEDVHLDRRRSPGSPGKLQHQVA
jgi:hypothetical protein